MSALAAEFASPFASGPYFRVLPACHSSCLAAMVRTQMSDSPVPISPSAEDSRRPARSESLQNTRADADRELIRSFTSGDEADFAIFYRRFSPGLFSLVYRILQDQKESEDVLQEAFVQMWKNSATYDASRSSLFTWAVMIARNKAIDRLRARQRRIRIVEAASVEAEVAPAAAVEQADEALSQNDERSRVRAALASLSQPQREAIDLAFFAGMTQAEIATKLGTPLGTVKARIRRGLLALRQVLPRASS